MAEVAGDGRRLRVDLDVDPSDDWDRPVASETADASAVAGNAAGRECTVDVQPADDDGLVRARGEVSDDCLCRIFQRFGCVPHVRRVEDGAMLVTAYVDDRDTVRDLVCELRKVLDRVRLVRLAVLEGPPPPRGRTPRSVGRSRSAFRPIRRFDPSSRPYPGYTRPTKPVFEGSHGRETLPNTFG